MHLWWRRWHASKRAAGAGTRGPAGLGMIRFAERQALHLWPPVHHAPTPPSAPPGRSSGTPAYPHIRNPSNGMRAAAQRSPQSRKRLQRLRRQYDAHAVFHALDGPGR